MGCGAYALRVYQFPSEDERPGCRETAVITRAIFGILLPPVLAIIALLVLIFFAFILLAIHPVLVVLPVLAGAGGIYLFARWEQGRHGPPGL